MLPEVASSMVETRNIVTPVRSFCKKAKFYQAKIESIDLNSEKLTLTHAIGRQSQPNDWREHILNMITLLPQWEVRTISLRR